MRHRWIETYDSTPSTEIDVTCDVCGMQKVRDAQAREWDVSFPDGSLERLESVPECEG